MSGIRFATAPTCDSTRAAQTQRARAQSVKAISPQRERRALKLLASDAVYYSLRAGIASFGLSAVWWWCKRGAKAKQCELAPLGR